CEILLVLDGRVCFHVPGEIVRARVRCRDHADRRAFGKGSECIECADPGADIGAAGDHGLLGFAGALGIENLQEKPVLLEEAGDTIKALRKVEALDFDRIVPGHGPASAPKAEVTAIREYLEDLTRAVSAAKEKVGNPLALDQITELVKADLRPKY